MKTHICLPEHSSLPGMRELYSQLRIYPSSPNGDEILIRSHIAYWSGPEAAERAIIKPSRGSSYRVNRDACNPGLVVRIVDYYDHREGVIGWRHPC